MIAFSLDISSVCTGWSIVKNNQNNIEILDYGDLKKNKLSSLEYMVLTFDFVSDIIKKYNPDILFIENTFLRNTKTLKILMEFHGVVEIAAAKNGIKNIIKLYPSEIRKLVFNKGNITKKSACEFLEKKFNLILKSSGYDISDALAIAIAGFINEGLYKCF